MCIVIRCVFFSIIGLPLDKKKQTKQEDIFKKFGFWFVLVGIPKLKITVKSNGLFVCLRMPLYNFPITLNLIKTMLEDVLSLSPFEKS